MPRTDFLDFERDSDGRSIGIATAASTSVTSTDPAAMRVEEGEGVGERGVCDTGQTGNVFDGLHHSLTRRMGLLDSLRLVADRSS